MCWHFTLKGTQVEAVSEGQESRCRWQIQTPFYAECGEVVMVISVLIGYGTRFTVEDTQKILPHVHGHYGVVT